MDMNESVILITGIDSGTVQSIQKRLESSNIPSVHVSSGNKIPYPVGVRVRLKDLERSKKILKSFGLKPYEFSKADRLRAKRHFIVLISIGGLALAFFILVITGLIG